MGEKPNAFVNSRYRIMLNIKRLDKVSNERIYDLTCTSLLLSTAILRQLKFLGHRMNPLTSTRCMNPPKGEDPRKTENISPFPPESRNGSNTNKHFSEDDIVCTA